MRGWKHVFYRIKVSFVFHFLRFKSKLHFTNRKLIDNCSLMDNIEFLLQLVIYLSIVYIIVYCDKRKPYLTVSSFYNHKLQGNIS